VEGGGDPALHNQTLPVDGVGGKEGNRVVGGGGGGEGNEWVRGLEGTSCSDLGGGDGRWRGRGEAAV
jgi:hypothetical protein